MTIPEAAATTVAAGSSTYDEAPLVGLHRIIEAAATLAGVAVRTPLVPFGPPEHRRFLKAESLQPIGAFKIRGAYVAVASLTADERARGVITYSSGNHAQGVARAARLLGAPAVVVMPSDAPEIKRGTRRRRRRRDRRRRVPPATSARPSRSRSPPSGASRSSRRSTTTG